MKSLPLHLCTVHIFSNIINRFYVLLHLSALIALIYYRLSSFSLSKPTLLYLLVFSSELLLSLIWLCTQAFLWRQVSRTTFLQSLPEDKDLPPIDVFICTADPKKEPTVEVMNTVLSAMALDYPPEKLNVYVSDDAASYLTLNGVRETWEFARFWVPFCRKFGVKSSRCPKAYFSSLEHEYGDHSSYVDFEGEEEKIKTKYELFKNRVKQLKHDGESEEAKTKNSEGHPPLIEVMKDKPAEMPRLVYVAREKKPSHPHNFKAGALNVLLRVSSVITNSPYVLVLDCDMNCNDPTSARQAMCFHLDPKISSFLAFVQFPQQFHNINKIDIYDSQVKTIFMIWWPGMDGLQGPILSGTGFYMKRKALYDDLSLKDPEQLKQVFGLSNEFVASILQNNQHNMIADMDLSHKVQEAQFLATCTYEKDTLWGKKIGFLYLSLVEDYFTGFILHNKGWSSVFCNPTRPAFLGTGTINLQDKLVQVTRGSSGFFKVTCSRFCPLIYGLPRMSLLQTMCYGYFSLQPVYSLPVWGLATLPQLCLLGGIPIYPKVTSSWFMVFSFIFIASMLKQLQEVHSIGGSIQMWWNMQRIWMIRSVTAYTYGISDAVLTLIGLRQASFVPTSKVADNEQVALYQKGKFNFQASTILLAPIVTLVILNMISLVGGVARIVLAGGWAEMFGQVFLSFYILVVNFPVIEGMLLRKDKGCVPFSVSLLSLGLSVAFLCLGSIIVLCQVPSNAITVASWHYRWQFEGEGAR